VSGLPAQGVVKVWQQRDGLWRWHWDGPQGERLLSYMAFDSLEEAKESAEESYPGIVLEAPRHEPGKARKAAKGLVARLFLGAVVVLLVLAARHRVNHRAVGTPG
jgi:hypothetical protein